MSSARASHSRFQALESYFAQFKGKAASKSPDSGDACCEHKTHWELALKRQPAPALTNASRPTPKPLAFTEAKGGIDTTEHHLAQASDTQRMQGRVMEATKERPRKAAVPRDGYGKALTWRPYNRALLRRCTSCFRVSGPGSAEIRPPSQLSGH